jgi:hypothetical protein
LKGVRTRQVGRLVEMGAAKEEARMLIEQVPDHVTWDDIMYELYVKKKLAKALDEAAAGQVVLHEEAKGLFSSKSEGSRTSRRARLALKPRLATDHGLLTTDH